MYTIQEKEIITSKLFQYKNLKLKESGLSLTKFGKGKSHVKICCISDTHQNHNFIKIPDNIDILIHAGDFCDGDLNKKKHVNNFLNWYIDIKAKYKYLICGNHDLYLEHMDKKTKNDFIEDMKKNNILYLENNFGVYPDLNLNIYGFPQILKRNMPYESIAFEVDAQKLNEICNTTFNKKIDILITHGPPYDILDKTKRNIKIGSLTLLEDLILREQPSIHVFGHNHDEYGYKIYEFKGKEILFINSSVKKSSNPIVFDYYYD